MVILFNDHPFLMIILFSNHSSLQWHWMYGTYFYYLAYYENMEEEK